VIADIPFFRPGSIDIGPLELQPFGIMVATGVILGVHLMRRWGEAQKLDDDHIRGLVNWSIVCGFIGAHLFDVLAYQWHRLAEDPLLLFKIWQGISSYGGFIGGTLGFFIYAKRHRLPLGRYADAAMIAFAPGFTFGRIGCSLVHDHIGAYTDKFFLATYYSEDVIRRYGFGSPPGGLKPGLHHNLGFYELLYMLLLCALLYGLSRWRNRPHGFMAAAVAAAYAPVRFFLDALRVNAAADPRYFGLTFAQWMSIVLMVWGLYLLVHLVKHRDDAELSAAGVPGGAADADKADAGSSKPGAGKPGAGKRRRKRK
jgi:phosphatidylglycerol:prolipoprotein diacylglycerol transferase